MSNLSRTARFVHSNDCVQSGCPGHEMKLWHHYTSDMVSFEVDGERMATFDPEELKTLISLEAELRKYETGETA